jgi:hypothetical protein
MEEYNPKIQGPDILLQLPSWRCNHKSKSRKRSLLYYYYTSHDEFMCFPFYYYYSCRLTIFTMFWWSTLLSALLLQGPPIHPPIFYNQLHSDIIIPSQPEWHWWLHPAAATSTNPPSNLLQPIGGTSAWRCHLVLDSRQSVSWTLVYGVSNRYFASTSLPFWTD